MYFQVLSAFVYGCLQAAEQNNFSSIAFPAIGTGACGFPGPVVASTMFDAIEKFAENYPNTQIRRVQIVIWKDDAATVKVA